MRKFNVTDERLGTPIFKFGDIVKLSGNYYIVAKCYKYQERYLTLVNLEDGRSWTDVVLYDESKEALIDVLMREFPDITEYINTFDLNLVIK